MEFEHLLEKQEHKDFVPTDFVWIINKFEEELGNKLSEKGDCCLSQGAYSSKGFASTKLWKWGVLRGLKMVPKDTISGSES